jgi:hypothetical protein
VREPRQPGHFAQERQKASGSSTLRKLNATHVGPVACRYEQILDAPAHRDFYKLALYNAPQTFQRPQAACGCNPIHRSTRNAGTLPNDLAVVFDDPKVNDLPVLSVTIAGGKAPVVRAPSLLSKTPSSSGLFVQSSRQ